MASPDPTPSSAPTKSQTMVLPKPTRPSIPTKPGQEQDFSGWFQKQVDQARLELSAARARSSPIRSTQAQEAQSIIQPENSSSTAPKSSNPVSHPAVDKGSSCTCSPLDRCVAPKIQRDPLARMGRSTAGDSRALRVFTEGLPYQYWIRERSSRFTGLFAQVEAAARAADLESLQKTIVNATPESALPAPLYQLPVFFTEEDIASKMRRDGDNNTIPEEFRGPIDEENASSSSPLSASDEGNVEPGPDVGPRTDTSVVVGAAPAQDGRGVHDNSGTRGGSGVMVGGMDTADETPVPAPAPMVSPYPHGYHNFNDPATGADYIPASARTFHMYHHMTPEQLGAWANAAQPHANPYAGMTQANASSEPHYPVAGTHDGQQYHYVYGSPVYYTQPDVQVINSSSNVGAHPPPAVIAVPSPTQAQTANRQLASPFSIPPARNARRGNVEAERVAHGSHLRLPPTGSHAIPVRVPPGAAPSTKRAQCTQRAAYPVPVTNEGSSTSNRQVQAQGLYSPRYRVANPGVLFPSPGVGGEAYVPNLFFTAPRTDSSSGD